MPACAERIKGLVIRRENDYREIMTEYMTMTAESPPTRSTAIKLYDESGFAGMRKAGRLAADILDALAPLVVPGITTGEIDDIVRRLTIEGGGVPATMGYRGYQHSCCTSINNVICHGIPGERELKEGDIVNIDVTPAVDGWHGDSSRMYIAGEAPIKAKRLIEVTYECLMLGIEQAKPGNHLGDVGHAIQRHAEKHRYGVVRDFCGHGLDDQHRQAGCADDGGWLDGRDARSHLVGAVRTQRRHHRNRLRDFHEKRERAGLPAL